jgi:protein TonB
LAHSSGFSRLDKAALAAVKSWRFLPQRQDAALISSWIVVPVRFDLQKKESVRG